MVNFVIILFYENLYLMDIDIIVIVEKEDVNCKWKVCIFCINDLWFEI